MPENKIDMQIGLGVEYDATGMDEANADLAQLSGAKEQLVHTTNAVTEADAKEQRAMKLATKSRNELIQTLKRLQKELKTAAEAQDVEKYRAVEQEIAETRGAFEKQNQVLELNNIQMGQQAQNGIMVANTLAGMAKGLQDGSLSAGDFASGFMAISAAMKAGLGPIGWVMLAIQGLQAAWDYFSAESKKEEETRKKRWEDMQRLAEMTDEARTALENYNRTELSKKNLHALQGYYANINRELESQIKNIQRATDAELARLAITQDEQEHKRTMQRAKLGRQLAAGTITQEEYDAAMFDMNEAAAKQGLDDEVSAAEVVLKDAQAQAEAARKAMRDKDGKLAELNSKRNRYGDELTVDRLQLMLDQFTKLQKEVDDAWEARRNAEDDDERLLAHKRWSASRDELDPLRAQIIAAYSRVHGKGAQRRAGLTDAEALAALIHERKDLDTRHKLATDEAAAATNLYADKEDATRDAQRDLDAAEKKRSRELGQLADEREENEKDRALQKLLAEKQKAATELAKMETTELRRLQKEAQKRANAAREAGDADGAAVLEKLAALYKDEIAQRRAAAKAKGAVDAARNKAEAAAPTQDKRTDDVLREAQQLANRIAKGESLDGRSAEQLLTLWKQAQASKDKKDDAFVAQLIQLMQLQADVGAGLQAEVRKLKRKTEKLTSRNFD